MSDIFSTGDTEFIIGISEKMPFEKDTTVFVNFTFNKQLKKQPRYCCAIGQISNLYCTYTGMTNITVDGCSVRFTPQEKLLSFSVIMAFLIIY